AVLVTCSSIGEATEAVAREAAVPVVRVDTAMARAAVAAAVQGGRGITVLATLASTLGPTTRLIEREAADAAVTVRSRVIDGAVSRREAGDQAGHDAMITAAVEQALAGDDIVVLAQAS